MMPRRVTRSPRHEAADITVATRSGRKLAAARKAADNAYEAARVVALKAINDGIPEAVAARLLNVNRMTIRKWLANDDYRCRVGPDTKLHPPVDLTGRAGVPPRA